MTKKQRNNLIRIIAAAVLLVALHFVAEAFFGSGLSEAGGDASGGAGFGPAAKGRLILGLFYLVPYILVGGDILKKAWKGILNRQPLDENLLMAIATIGAFVLAFMRTGDFTEAVAVMLFYQIGELFQSIAVGRSRKNIGELMDIRPDYANIEGPDGVEKVDPDEVEPGTVILVQPGEKIPIDGVVVEGHASLDTSALTGESVPRSVKPGDEVISGCINSNGVLRIRTTREFDESTASKILDLVENASSRKAQSEKFISRFARVYTPVVVIGAACLAVIPPLVLWLTGSAPNTGEWIYRALTFLVISCPCALVISIPLSFFAGIGGASRAGILVKGSNFLEALAGTKTVVMDKTGTLTRGVFKVTKIYSDPGAGVDPREILRLAAAGEQHSSHPIALALKAAWAEQAGAGEAGADENDEVAAAQSDVAAGAPVIDVNEVEEIAGHGVCVRIDGKQVCLGNDKLMRRQNIEVPGGAAGGMSSAAADGTSGAAEGTSGAAEGAGTVIHVGVDGVWIGYILISDQVKPTSGEAIARLRREGVSRIVMLTGDAPAAANAVAGELGITEVCSGLLPADKVDKVEELLGEPAADQTAGPGSDAGPEDDRPAPDRKKSRGTLVFVGDGINDAPVLSRADVGVAMGALGSDAAIEAADIVLMDDDPLGIPRAIRIARKCMAIVRENIVFAIGVKVLCLLLCAFGLVGMWAAIFADVGVMVLAVLNAIRTLFAARRNDRGAGRAERAVRSDPNGSVKGGPAEGDSSEGNLVGPEVCSDRLDRKAPKVRSDQFGPQ